MLAKRFVGSNIEISPTQIAQQIKIPNQDFSKTNIAFKLSATRRVINMKWFNDVGYMNQWVSSSRFYDLSHLTGPQCSRRTQTVNRDEEENPRGGPTDAKYLDNEVISFTYPALSSLIRQSLCSFSLPGIGTMGYGAFPWKYDGNPTQDGVTMAGGVFYGGSVKDFKGRYLTHEVGHWVGLYHTFEVRNDLSHR